MLLWIFWLEMWRKRHCLRQIGLLLLFGHLDGFLCWVFFIHIRILGRSGLVLGGILPLSETQEWSCVLESVTRASVGTGLSSQWAKSQLWRELSLYSDNPIAHLSARASHSSRAFVTKAVSKMKCVIFFPPDLEVHLLNTEMDVQDLSFPQNSASDSTIQLSASTIKQYSRNGQWSGGPSASLHPSSHHPPPPSPCRRSTETVHCPAPSTRLPPFAFPCMPETICVQLNKLAVHHNGLIRLRKVLRQFLFLMVS